LADLKKSSPLKPLGQMNRNLVGNIYGRSSIKFAHFVMIRLQTWPPQAIIVSDWLIPTKFQFNWLSSFREENFEKSINQIQELPVAAMFVNESGRKE
jgi:hypothetical protein